MLFHDTQTWLDIRRSTGWQRPWMSRDGSYTDNLEECLSCTQSAKTKILDNILGNIKRGRAKLGDVVGLRKCKLFELPIAGCFTSGNGILCAVNFVFLLQSALRGRWMAFVASACSHIVVKGLEKYCGYVSFKITMDGTELPCLLPISCSRTWQDRYWTIPGKSLDQGSVWRTLNTGQGWERFLQRVLMVVSTNSFQVLSPSSFSCWKREWDEASFDRSSAAAFCCSQSIRKVFNALYTASSCYCHPLFCDHPLLSSSSTLDLISYRIAALVCGIRSVDDDRHCRHRSEDLSKVVNCCSRSQIFSDVVQLER